MKYTFINAVLACVVLSISCIANAGIITLSESHNGYTLTNDGSYYTVTGHGEEFLHLSNTKGMSINLALDTFSSLGWKLASTAQGSILMNNFFDDIVWDANAGSGQGESLPSGSILDAATDHWSDVFGSTSEFDYSIYGGDLLVSSSALFGDGLIRSGEVRYERIYARGAYSSNKDDNYNGYVSLSANSYSSSFTNRSMAVLLVRDIAQSTNPVPEPTTLAIFAIGMIGLASRANSSPKCTTR